jgi:hypothetical protein
VAGAGVRAAGAGAGIVMPLKSIDRRDLQQGEARNEQMVLLVVKE